ncbi:MAG TPA: helix-turn-helix domain-containing protein [Candidatus Nanoarchaeia archaeon]|nr:helix-turn-helix domain-containing protein [Candidatus Nanoarchaeia archaeon]
MTEKFLLVNLEEENTKKLADVLANSTARKLLNYLSTVEDASESELANKLKLPLTTVHYNLQNLKKTGLVEAPAFTWSQKGRPIDRYTIAKKSIIISPKGVTINKEKMRRILGVGIISGIGATLAGYIMQHYPTTTIEQPVMMAKFAETTALAITTPPTEPKTWLFYTALFCIGTFVTMVLYTLFNWKER